MRKHLEDRKYQWSDFAGSYFKLAEIGCKEYLASLSSSGDVVEDVKKFINPSIYAPIVFNIKHGIECSLKTLSYIIDEKYRWSHDLNKLFVDFISKINKLNLKLVTDKRGNKITQEQIDQLPSHLDELKIKVSEFYELIFLPKAIRENIKIFDSENDVFRYPKNKVDIEIDWDDLFQSVDETLIRSLVEKLNKLQDIYSSIGWVLDINSTKDLHYRDIK